MATAADLYRSFKSEWENRPLADRLKSLGFTQSYSGDDGAQWVAPEGKYADLQAQMGNDNNDAGWKDKFLNQAAAFDPKTFINKYGIVPLNPQLTGDYGDTGGKTLDPQAAQQYQDNQARSYNQFGFPFKNWEDLLKYRTGSGHWEDDPQLGKFWVADNSDTSKWNENYMGASANQGSAIDKAVRSLGENGTLVKAGIGAVLGAGFGDVFNGGADSFSNIINGGGTPNIPDWSGGTDTFGGVDAGGTLPSGDIIPSETGDLIQNANGTIGESGTQVGQTAGSTATNTVIGPGQQYVDQISNYLQKQFQLTPQNALKAATTLLGKAAGGSGGGTGTLPKSDMKNSGGTLLPAGSKSYNGATDTASLVKAGILNPTTGQYAPGYEWMSMAGGGGGSTSGGGGTLTDTGDDSWMTQLLPWLNAGGQIADFFQRPDVIGAAGDLLKNAVDNAKKPYTPFDASTFMNNPQWQDYIKGLVDPGIGRINEASAQAKNAAKAKAAMSGQDISAYGSLPGQPDVQDALLERSRLDSIGTLTANATDKAFTNAMNQYQAGYTLPLTAEQAAAGTLYAAKSLGAPSIGQLTSNLTGAAGTSIPGSTTQPKWLQDLLKGTGATTTPSGGTSGTGVGLPGTGGTTGTQPNPIMTGDDDGNPLPAPVMTGDDDGNPLPGTLPVMTGDDGNPLPTGTEGVDWDY